MSIGYLLNVTPRTDLAQKSAAVVDLTTELRADYGDKLTGRLTTALDGVGRLAELRTAVLARRGSARHPRDQRRSEHRPPRQPRMHARQGGRGALADRPHPARHAGLHPLVDLTDTGVRPLSSREAAALPDPRRGAPR